MIAYTRSIDVSGDVQKMRVTRARFGPSSSRATYARPTGKPSRGYMESGQTSVTLPFRLLNNHVYIEAKVNGKGPYTFIVDTGGHTLLSPRVAAEAGLKVEGAGVTSDGGAGTST